MFFGNKIIYLTYSDIALKVLVVAQGSKKPKVFFYDQHTLDSGIVFDDKIADLGKFRDEVRKFIEANQDKFWTKKIIVAVNEQDSFFLSFANPGVSKNLESELSKYLADKLPFNVIEANTQCFKRNSDTYQIEVVKSSFLTDLDSVFHGSNLKLIGFFPIPTTILNFLANQDQPYIYVISEDKTLIFSLVIQNVIVFSSTLKLINEVKDSAREITKAIDEITKIKNGQSEKTLKNIYCSGQGCEFLTEFFKDRDLNIVNLPLIDKFKEARASDLDGYTKCLLLALAKKSQFIYYPPFETAIRENSTDKKLSIPEWLKKAVFAGLLILVVAALIYFGFRVFTTKDSSNTTDKDINRIIDKIASNSFKPVSSNSAKKEATTTSNPKVVEPAKVNKKEYKISVLNGTNTAGLAGQTRVFLTSKGYSNITIGNASTRDYNQTIIRLKPSKIAIKNDLTTDLQELYSITVGSSLSEADTYDIIIIIGRK